MQRVLLYFFPSYILLILPGKSRKIDREHNTWYSSIEIMENSEAGTVSFSAKLSATSLEVDLRAVSVSLFGFVVAMFDSEEGPDGVGPLLSLKVGVRKRKYQSLNSISVISDERVSTKYQEITS